MLDQVMRGLLLDTHIFLWWAEDSARLLSQVNDLIDRAVEVYRSSVAAWEIEIKQAKGKLPGDLFEKMNKLTYNSSMTITDIKTELHNRIEHLSEAQIKKLQKLVNDTFPQKARTKVSSKKRQLVGSMKGLVIHMADDFNEPLDDFKEYMPE